MRVSSQPSSLGGCGLKSSPVRPALALLWLPSQMSECLFAFRFNIAEVWRCWVPTSQRCSFRLLFFCFFAFSSSDCHWRYGAWGALPLPFPFPGEGVWWVHVWREGRWQTVVRHNLWLQDRWEVGLLRKCVLLKSGHALCFMSRAAFGRHFLAVLFHVDQCWRNAHSLEE